jgi:hypothetical protein
MTSPLKVTFVGRYRVKLDTVVAVSKDVRILQRKAGRERRRTIVQRHQAGVDGTPEELDAGVTLVGVEIRADERDAGERRARVEETGLSVAGEDNTATAIANFAQVRVWITKSVTMLSFRKTPCTTFSAKVSLLRVMSSAVTVSNSTPFRVFPTTREFFSVKPLVSMVASFSDTAPDLITLEVKLMPLPPFSVKKELMKATPLKVVSSALNPSIPLPARFGRLSSSRQFPDSTLRS